MWERGSGAAAIHRPYQRPMFVNLLAEEWFPQVPGLVERLTADPPARVVDVGCGSGWSAIAIARGFPKVEVTGLDLDPESVNDARRNAEEAGVADSVSFDGVTPPHRRPRRQFRPGVCVRDDPRHVRSGCAARGAHCVAGSVLFFGPMAIGIVSAWRAGRRRTGRRHLHGRRRRRRALPMGLQRAPLPPHSHDGATGRRHGDHHGSPVFRQYAIPTIWPMPGSLTLRCCPSRTTSGASTTWSAEDRRRPGMGIPRIEPQPIAKRLGAHRRRRIGQRRRGVPRPRRSRLTIPRTRRVHAHLFLFASARTDGSWSVPHPGGPHIATCRRRGRGPETAPGVNGPRNRATPPPRRGRR